MFEINLEELMDRIWDELLPGEPPHHRKDYKIYYQAVADVHKVAEQLLKEKQDALDEYLTGLELQSIRDEDENKQTH